MNIAEMLFKNSGLNSMAVKCGTKSISYSALCDQVRKLSLSIINKGSHIGIFMENSIEHIVAFFSIAYSGNAIIPINIKLSGREIRKICAECEMVGVFSLLKYKEKIESMGIICPVWYIDNVDLGNKTDAFKAMDLTNQRAVILLTSGTLGNPKYIVLSHSSLFYNIEYMGRRFKRLSGGREAVIFPLCSILAVAQMLHSISNGMVLELVQGDLDVYKLCDLFVQEKITSSAMVPSILKMFGMSVEIGKYVFPSLERIFYAGEYLPKKDFCVLQRQLPNVCLIQAYGMTEISPICMKDETDFAYKPESAGKIFPEVAVKIMDHGTEVERGCVGEIYAQGSNMMDGYLNEKKFLEDGYVATGDIGYLDSESYLFICGRSKNIIISGGQNIYPEEVEAVLQSYPGIREVKIYGQKDKDRGEAIAADIVLTNSEVFDRKSFYEFCRNNIAVYKMPQIINICKEIEKTITYKKVRK